VLDGDPPERLAATAVDDEGETGKTVSDLIKVLALAWEFPPRFVGGLARHVDELYRAMANHRVEIHLVTAHHPGAPAEEVVTKGEGGGRLVVHRAPADPVVPQDFATGILEMNFGLCETAVPLVSGAGFSLIHGHDWLVAPAARTLKHAYRLPLVATIHGTEHGRNQGLHTPLQHYIHAWEWLLIHEAWRAICVSHYIADEVQRVHAAPADKLDVVYNGIDPGRLIKRKMTVAEKAEFRNRFAGDGQRMVLFVGRMVREKGAHILVEAAPQVLARHPETVFVLVGGGPSDHLRARARELRLDSRIKITGFISDDELDRLYQVASVAVYPSLYEPFGIVALEAMAAGVPVVTSDAGGLPEVVEHDRSGLLTWANNADSLAIGINRVLDDDQLARRLARAGRRRVRQSFAWDSIAERTIETYRRVSDEWQASAWRRGG
jgi:glycogen(starch) synthase